jgi:hypothetical protein
VKIFKTSVLFLIFLFVCSVNISYAGLLPWTQEGKDFLDGSAVNVEFATNGNVSLPAPAYENLFLNASFEDGTNNWTVGSGFARDAAYSHSGGWAMKLVATGGTSGSCQAVNAFHGIVGHTYKLSAWFYVSEHSSGNWVFLDIDDLMLPGDCEFYANQVGSWHYVSNTVKFSSTPTVDPKPRIAAHAGTGIIAWIDDVRLEDLDSTMLPYTSGTYTSAALDCGNTTTFGNISWVADVPPGCSITFLTASAATEAGLISAAFETATTTISGSGEAEILSSPNKYIQFRSILRS